MQESTALSCLATPSRPLPCSCVPPHPSPWDPRERVGVGGRPDAPARADLPLFPDHQYGRLRGHHVPEAGEGARVLRHRSGGGNTRRGVSGAFLCLGLQGGAPEFPQLFLQRLHIPDAQTGLTGLSFLVPSGALGPPACAALWWPQGPVPDALMFLSFGITLLFWTS